MNSIISFVKDNSVTVLKIGGITLSITGIILANIANDKQQRRSQQIMFKDLVGRLERYSSR